MKLAACSPIVADGTERLHSKDMQWNRHGIGSGTIQSCGSEWAWQNAVTLRCMELAECSLTIVHGTARIQFIVSAWDCQESVQRQILVRAVMNERIP
jgi:hypothetical protein